MILHSYLIMKQKLQNSEISFLFLKLSIWFGFYKITVVNDWHWVELIIQNWPQICHFYHNYKHISLFCFNITSRTTQNPNWPRIFKSGHLEMHLQTFLKRDVLRDLHESINYYWDCIKMTDISQFCLQKLNTGFACPVSNTEYILAHSLVFAADQTIEYY